MRAQAVAGDSAQAGGASPASDPLADAPPYFLVLLVARLLSAAYNIVQDCDETYNYWEPLHWWHFGSGLQTWENRRARGPRRLKGGQAVNKRAPSCE